MADYVWANFLSFHVFPLEKYAMGGKCGVPLTDLFLFVPRALSIDFTDFREILVIYPPNVYQITVFNKVGYGCIYKLADFTWFRGSI